MAALADWGGALLLEPVGTGKTWIALAVAAAHAGGVVAIVPAILRNQWQACAARAGIQLEVATHECSSRGHRPSGNPQLVIIDEAHRFRNAASRRTRTIAPWLVGRRVLLLTATPIVNRIADLVTLLRLAVPEDALVLDGIAGLGDLEVESSRPAAVRRVAIRTRGISAGNATRRLVRIAPTRCEELRADAAVRSIARLRLSHVPAIRQLIRSVLLDAGASSDAAYHQALRRYRALLLHSRDAGGASRRMLRQFVGEQLEQLVLWPMTTDGGSDCDLPVADLERVEPVLREVGGDREWIAQLLSHIGDRTPTVYFTRHRATAILLRTALGDGCAWVSGTEAGIGPHRMPRALVLGAFGAERSSWSVRRVPPTALVATDVAAEGLDLFAAGRIVHVDLPWTAMRLVQREGRLLRLGQVRDNVEVVVRIPAAAIETALAPSRRLRRKDRLQRDWLEALETDDPRPAGEAISVVRDHGTAADLVVVRLTRGSRIGVVALVREHDGEWRAAGVSIDRLIARANRADSPGAAIDPRTVLRSAIAAAISIGLANTPSGTPPPSATIARIHHLARKAAIERNATAMQHLDRLLRFVAAPPTLGGRMLTSELAAMPDDKLLVAAIPDVPERPPIRAHVVAAILFRPADVPLR